jgi:hypothetical protein
MAERQYVWLKSWWIVTEPVDGALQSRCNAVDADVVDITPGQREFGRLGATWCQASKEPNAHSCDSCSGASSAAAKARTRSNTSEMVPTPIPPNILWSYGQKGRI